MNFQAYTLNNHPEWACITVKTPDSQERTPVHLCCVIDTSGSMDIEHKLENVIDSLKFLVDFLGPQDSISIITFSEVARTIIKQAIITSTEKENIRARISLIHTEGNTNLSGGIIESRGSLLTDTSSVKQGILLLTDGMANMGLIHTSDILDVVRNTIAQFSGTSISCVGYGTDHNVDLLQQISAVGGGSYYIVNNLENVATVFGDVLGSLMSCVAQQVRVVLPPGTEVKTRYSINKIDDGMEVVIGDLPASMEGVVLAKIPNGSVVGLKGYNLQTHSNIELNTTVLTSSDDSLQTSGEAHYLRFEVLAILDKSKNLILRRSNDSDVNAHIKVITECIAKITEYRQGHEHSLWNVLIDELNNCKTTLENRHSARHDITQHMTQHGACLGMLRGIASSSAEEEDNAPGSSNTSIPLAPVFSNSVQRSISSQLQTNVTPIVARQRSHDLGALRPIGENNSWPPMPPMVFGGLVRQTACSMDDPIYNPSQVSLASSISDSD